MAKDPYRYFRIEAGELLQQLAKGALDLEKSDAGAAPVMHMLRLAHTLKGAARVVRLAGIADLAHGMEESLSPYREGLAVPRELVDRILATIDAMNKGVAGLTQPAADPLASQPSTPPVHDQAGGATRLARADIAEVEVVLEGLGEIGNELETLRRIDTSMEKMRGLSRQLARQATLTPLGLQAVATEMQALAGSVERSLGNGMRRVQRELEETRDAAQRLRLVPVTEIFNTLERTARDAAHHTGKQVSFEARGGEVRIEGEVLDRVQSAMIQLVRNAIAHGIESPAQRVQAGKDAAGRVTVEARRRGNHVHFHCSDDGAGIDLDAVRRELTSRGDAASSAASLGERELVARLLQGGISTSATVSEISGRGIGLNLVRAALLELNGEILADTVPGKGTRLELRVPLRLAALQVLLIESAGQVVALPLDSIRHTLRLAPNDILHLPTGEAIVHDGKQVPLLPLQLHARSGRSSPATPAFTVVVVKNAAGSYAVKVDRLCGMEHIVLRPLPALTPADPIVLGLYFDIEGNPRLVLDPEQFNDDLRDRAHAAAAQGPMPKAAHPILIVDDSLTTRMLECSILESAGFAVEMAASAEEGLVMAGKKTYALFLVDVEMPGIDGFEFAARTRADPVLGKTPCILVTSRNAPEDLQRGRDAGANDYIVKGEFDQARFLERVRELVVS